MEIEIYDDFKGELSVQYLSGGYRVEATEALRDGEVTYLRITLVQETASAPIEAPLTPQGERAVQEAYEKGYRHGGEDQRIYGESPTTPGIPSKEVEEIRQKNYRLGYEIGLAHGQLKRAAENYGEKQQATMADNRRYTDDLGAFYGPSQPRPSNPTAEFFNRR